MHLRINIQGVAVTVLSADAELNTNLAPPISTALDSAARAALLRNEATRIRRSVVEMIGRARMGHIGGDLSTTGILATFVFAGLRGDPASPATPDRDPFILSKGHCAAALYSTLALRGFLPVETLSTFMQPLSA